MARTYDRRLANRISLWIVLVVAIAVAAYMALQLATDPISAGDSGLRVRALFGFSLPYAEIKSVDLFDGPAPSGSRIAGNSAFGLFREGDYNVEGIGRARIFIKKPELSYLRVTSREGRDYLLSLGSKEKDRLLFDAIKAKLGTGPQ